MSPLISYRPGAAGLLAGALVTGGLAFAPAALAASTSPARITEIHYDNAGTDANEAIEVTAPTAAGLTGLSVVLYNGNGGAGYSTTAVPASSTGIAVISYPVNGIQNGDPDGMALVDGTGQVVEFLSYGGPLTATNGPAQGLTSTDIGVKESGSPVGESLQRYAGSDTWFGPAPNTFGAANPAQTTTPPPSAATCDDPDAVPVGAVQGTGDTSAANGRTVTVQGTVVGDLRAGGFNGVDIEDAGDENDATSDGIFVFRPNLTGLEQGDVIAVRGKVSEFNGLTEIAGTDVVECGTAALPAPATLPIPSDGATRERYESMLVAPSTPLTVSDVYELDYYGEITLSSGGRLITPTEAADTGAPAQAIADQNARRSIVVDDGSTAKLAGPPRQSSPYLTVDDPVRVGDTAQLQPEVLHYTAGLWMLEPADGTWQGTTFAPTNPRPAAPPEVGGDLRIADFNVLNYFVDLHSQFPAARGAETAEELQKQQDKIVEAIATMNPDVATLHEIENSAVINPSSGEYHAVETLIAALEAKQGVPTGTWAYVKAHEDTDAITNAIIYRTDEVSAVGGPMVPDAADLAPFTNARTPIAQTFHAGDETFSIIANHLKSKGSSCGPGSDASDVEGGNCNGDRVDQARALVHFAEQVKQRSHDDDVLLSGDFNSYRFEDPVDVITNAGYVDEAPKRAPGEYSYVFDGASGSLDHTLASPSVDAKISGEGVWDINASESFAYEYDGDPELYADYPYRASDHNPTLVGLNTDVPATASVSDPNPQRGEQVTVTGRYLTAGTTVQVTVPRPGHPDVVTVTAGSDGTVSVPFRVHPGLRAGTYEVSLVAADGERTSASFTVAAPPESAPGR